MAAMKTSEVEVKWLSSARSCTPEKILKNLEIGGDEEVK
jgi:hypothetical protein